MFPNLLNFGIEKSSPYLLPFLTLKSNLPSHHIDPLLKLMRGTSHEDDIPSQCHNFVEKEKVPLILGQLKDQADDHYLLVLVHVHG